MKERASPVFVFEPGIVAPLQSPDTGTSHCEHRNLEEIPIHPYRRLLDRACRSLRGGSLTIRYWDGARVTYGHGEPQVRLTLKKPSVVPRLLLDPELAFGEAVMRGDLEIEGRLEDLIDLTASNAAPLPAVTDRLFAAAALFSRWRPLSMGRNRRDVSRHYDLGNDFYARWLDPTMTYSCAYFKTPQDSLETAQRQKMRHVLNKLQLAPGESLLDIGCGWGGIVGTAAREFGAQALGITLSDQQVAWFKDHQSSPAAANATSNATSNATGRGEIQLLHYHALAEQGRKFDKIVSVGMAEHVGRHRLPGYIRDVRRLLKPDGLGLIHCITSVRAEPTSAWIVKYIFPGGYIPAFGEIMREMMRQDLVIWDVENIGPHYALTLDHWAENFERNVEWVEARYGAEFVRMWRLYLRFSAASFRREDIYVHQILFSKNKIDTLPLTREHLITPSI